MKHHIQTQILIEAAPEKVWKVLTDFSSYPEWNPFVLSLKGEVQIGNQIEIKLPGMNFKPNVISRKENQEFSWLGHVYIKGLFDGHHQFVLEEQKDGSTLFIHKEDFKGLLVSLFRKKLDKETLLSFEEMNKALRNRVENPLK